MKKFSLTTIEEALVFLTALAILIIMLVTVVNVIGRYAFKAPFAGAIEVPVAFMILVGIVGMGGAQRRRIHVGIETFTEFLKKKSMFWFHTVRAINLVLFFITVGTMGGYYIPFALEAFRTHEETSGPLFLPQGPLKLLVAFGYLLCALRVGIQIVEEVRDMMKAPSAAPKAAARTSEGGGA